MKDIYMSTENALGQVENGTAVLIDVREPFEVENVWIDREDVLKMPYASLEERKEELPKNKRLIVCCAVGLVSEIAALQLRENGYEAVGLKDGLVGWKRAGFALKTFEEAQCKCKCCEQ